MAKKRTKAQKNRLVYAISLKIRECFMEGLVTAKDVEAVERICTRAFKKNNN